MRRINIIVLELALVVLFLFLDFIVMWQICNTRGARATGGLYDTYICTNTHTRFFRPSRIFCCIPRSTK